LVAGFWVAYVVSSREHYSAAGEPLDQESEELVSAWGDLEKRLQERAREQVVLNLSRDPMWPTHVDKAAKTSASKAAVKPKRRSTKKPSAVSKKPRKPVEQPRVLALLRDGEPRALVKYRGKSQVVRAGDRLGSFKVVQIEPWGVTVRDRKGVRKLLKIR
jgi:hypothetical protein